MGVLRVILFLITSAKAGRLLRDGCEARTNADNIMFRTGCRYGNQTAMSSDASACVKLCNSSTFVLVYGGSTSNDMFTLDLETGEWVEMAIHASKRCAAITASSGGLFVNRTSGVPMAYHYGGSIQKMA